VGLPYFQLLIQLFPNNTTSYILVFDEMMIYYFVEATFISNLLDLLDYCAKKLKNIIIQFTMAYQWHNSAAILKMI